MRPRSFFLPELREKVQPNRMMQEAQALRSLLIAAASQVIEDANQIPGKEGVTGFLSGYLAGKSVAEIAEELGVSRKWCSRTYRREALRSVGPPPATGGSSRNETGPANLGMFRR